MKKAVYANMEAERVKAGMSKTEMSEALGITTRSYYNYIHGLAPIPLKVILKCSKLFRCSVDYLLN